MSGVLILPPGVAAPAPMPADVEVWLDRLADRLGMLASHRVWFDSIGSTNDVALRLAQADAPHGTVVVADSQTQGRGRLGRAWASPAGAGLYASMVLRPPVITPVLTLAAGVGVARGIRAATGLDVDLKWPNDVLVGRRKLAGILAESGRAPAGEGFVVLGVGVNVHTASYPSDIAFRATSLEEELGRTVERGRLLAEVLAGCGESITDITDGRSDVVLAEWRERARHTLGRAVAWNDGGTEVRGVARGIDGTGALIIDAPGGVHVVTAGEVRWL